MQHPLNGKTARLMQDVGHHSDEAWCAAWSHDGKYLATASKDRSAIIWESTDFEGDPYGSWKEKYLLDGHASHISRIVWSPDDKKLGAISRIELIIWNMETGQEHTKLSFPHNDLVVGCNWNPMGDLMFLLPDTLDYAVCIKVINDSSCHTWSKLPPGSWDPALAFSHCQPWRLAVAANNELPDMFLPPSNEDGYVGGPGTRKYRGDFSTILPLKRLRGTRSTVAIYDWETKEVLMRLALPGSIVGLCFSKDDSYLLLSLTNNSVHLWNVETGTLVRRYYGRTAVDNIIRAHFGGERDEFIITGSENGIGFIWDRETGKLLDEIPVTNHRDVIANELCWNPVIHDLIASADDNGEVKTWRAFDATVSAD